MLPSLKWLPSPNVSTRSAPIDLVVLHDCQGSYAGSVAWFGKAESQVSAHFILKEDGTEATQMVDLRDKAWHACAFNSRSIGIEMAGFAERGFPDAEWSNAASIVAYLLRRYGLPLRWAHGGQGSGYCSHFDLGKAGGGHADPTTDARIWGAFMLKVEDAYKKGGFPASWARGEPDAGAPPIHGPAWLQAAINKLGADPQIAVDGVLGGQTKAALMPLQFNLHVPVTGQADPATIAAIEKALAALPA